MRPVILFMHTSLDGFVARPDGGLDWISYDQDLEQYANTLLQNVDTVMFGRATYHGMENFWRSVPDNPESTPHELQHSRWLDRTNKIVFSRTLTGVDWPNTGIISDNIADEIGALKQQSGSNIVILGSPGLAHSLTQQGLIDEYRLTISPIVLGHGTPLFEDVAEPIRLKLVSSMTLNSGVIIVQYHRQ